MGTPPSAWRAAAEKNITASEAGLELDLRFGRAGGRALVAHILARNDQEGESRSY